VLGAFPCLLRQPPTSVYLRSCTMSGPLTPPPTSETELMDQERDAGTTPSASTLTSEVVTAAIEPTTVTPAADPPPTATPGEAPMATEPTVAQTYYQQHLIMLADLVATRSWDEVIRVAELADLNVCISANSLGQASSRTQTNAVASG
jgi:hypothetical protein